MKTVSIDKLFDEEVITQEELFELTTAEIDEISQDNIGEIEDIVGEEGLITINKLIKGSEENMDNETKKTEATTDEETKEKTKVEKAEEKKTVVAGVEFEDEEEEKSKQEEFEFPFKKGKWSTSKSGKVIGVEFSGGEHSIAKATYSKLTVNYSNNDNKEHSDIYGYIEGETVNGNKANLSFARLTTANKDVVPIGFNLNSAELVKNFIELATVGIEKMEEIMEQRN